MQGAPLALRFNDLLAGRWTSATNDRTQPLQSVGVDLGPQVRRQADAALDEALVFRLRRPTAFVLCLLHVAQYT